MDKYMVRRIGYEDTKDLILNVHYAHRMPSISYAFGLFHDEELVGVITYGKPASPSLCVGICGKENARFVWELNRIVLKNNRKNEASYLIGKSLKMLPQPMILVSYVDSAQNHIGKIYQATNFLFTGSTRPRTDMASKDGKHSRHHLGDRKARVFRSSKHRYVCFIGDRRQKKYFMERLNYPIYSYNSLGSKFL